MGPPRTWRPPIATRIKVKTQRHPDIIGTVAALALAGATIALIVLGVLLAHTLVY